MILDVYENFAPVCHRRFLGSCSEDDHTTAANMQGSTDHITESFELMISGRFRGPTFVEFAT